MKIDKYPDIFSLETIIKFIPKRFLELGILEVIQTGFKGNTFRIRGKNDCILKVFLCQDNESRYQDALHELSIMKELKGTDRVIQLLDWEVNAQIKTVCWLEEYFQTLPDYLQSFVVSEYDRLLWIQDLCHVLLTMRNMGIYHLDIQPKNLFITPDKQIRIGNFSFSTQESDLYPPRAMKAYSLFMAPDVYRENRWSELSDIYSLGLVLYYLYNNQQIPFQNEISVNEAFQKRMSGSPIPNTVCSSSFCSDIVNRVIRYCCAFYPTSPYCSFESVEGLLSNAVFLLEKENKDEVAACQKRLLEIEEAAYYINQERNNHQYKLQEVEQNKHYAKCSLDEMTQRAIDAMCAADYEAQKLAEQQKKILEAEQASQNALHPVCTIGSLHLGNILTQVVTKATLSKAAKRVLAEARQKLEIQCQKCEEAKDVARIAKEELDNKIHEYKAYEEAIMHEKEAFDSQTYQIRELEERISQTKIELENKILTFKTVEKAVQSEQAPPKTVPLKKVQISALVPDVLQKGHYGLIDIYVSGGFPKYCGRCHGSVQQAMARKAKRHIHG